MPTYRYPVLARLLHDGDLYDPFETAGCTIDLDEDEAAELPDGVLGAPAPIDGAPADGTDGAPKAGAKGKKGAEAS